MDLRKLAGIARYSLALVTLTASGTLFADWSKNENIGGFTKTHIYTPSTVSPIGDGRSLLVILHGCTHPIDAYLTAQVEAPSEEYGMVIAAPDAQQKEGYACWGYWTAQSRTHNDYARIIRLVETMTADTSRNIDPKQVYIAGLSSGAAFANTTACLAPDLFAGMGISAGPTIGTAAGDAIGGVGIVSPSLYRSRCRGYAGNSNVAHFDTQIASMAHGENDTTVNTGYNYQNAKGAAALYDVSELPKTRTITEGASHVAEETMWEDGRVSMLWFKNLSHAWSGGAGASGSYVNSGSINYTRYLGEFFSENNIRVDRNHGPIISGVETSDNGSEITIEGNVTDEEGYVTSVSISAEGLINGETVSLNTNESGGIFIDTTNALADDIYLIEIFGTDDEGKAGDTEIVSHILGDNGPRAPFLKDVVVSTNQRCATVSGIVADINEDLDTVVVSFSTEDVTAEIDGFEFSAAACFLPGGDHTATVTATDDTDIETSESLSFNINAGVTATLSAHISAGRMDYASGYSQCYLAFGTDPFTMFEKAFGSNCRWEEAGNQCSGPEVQCEGPTTTPTPTPVVTVPPTPTPVVTVPPTPTPVVTVPPTPTPVVTVPPTPTPVVTVPPTPTPVVTVPPTPTPLPPTPTPAPTCNEVTAYNYYHKTGGRAHSSGSFWVPNYFANGSNEAMSGSTWGLTTLRHIGGIYWSVGSCP